ncbi:hypothetical protein CEXT_765401 [Caerostris extrusa]|uniref:Uncharacterized protein n=1 Tax=Caerostris extrusa TaxID=172846 RepID=A0AAV4M429_CAEEX|nr:hypothetical protein CEXT_765401 [Caerostris extrusa]
MEGISFQTPLMFANPDLISEHLVISNSSTVLCRKHMETFFSQIKAGLIEAPILQREIPNHISNTIEKNNKKVAEFLSGEASLSTDVRNCSFEKPATCILQGAGFTGEKLRSVLKVFIRVRILIQKRIPILIKSNSLIPASVVREGTSGLHQNVYTT